MAKAKHCDDESKEMKGKPDGKKKKNPKVAMIVSMMKAKAKK